MKTKHIIIGLIILVVVLFLMQKKEHAGSSTQNLSNDTIQNVAKVYADTSNTVNFNNIRTTGNANVKNLIAGGSGNFTGDVLFNGNTTFKRAGTGTGTTNFPASDGKNYIRGLTEIDDIAIFNTGANFKGGSGSATQTQFPNKEDGENYIRGTTNIEGEVTFNNDIIYRGNTLAECNWDGERTVWGNKGAEDDIIMDCKNNKVHKFRFAK